MAMPPRSSRADNGSADDKIAAMEEAGIQVRRARRSSGRSSWISSGLRKAPDVFKKILVTTVARSHAADPHRTEQDVHEGFEATRHEGFASFGDDRAFIEHPVAENVSR